MDSSCTYICTPLYTLIDLHVQLFQLSVIPWPSDSSYASDSFTRALNTLVSIYPCMLDHETMNTTEHYCSGKVQNSGGHYLE